MKRLFAMLIALMLLSSFAFTLTSCDDDGEGGSEDGGAGGETGGGQGEDNGKRTYTVQLKKPDGTGAPDVVVKLMKDGAQVTLARVDSDGKVSFTVDRGEYTLELMFVTGVVYGYDESALRISADSTETVIDFYDIPKGSDYEEGMNGVKAGHYLVDLNAEGLTYLIFSAEERGVYELYAADGDSLLDIGYYGGSPHYIFEENQAQKVDGKIYLEIRKMNLKSDTMEATPYIIGIKGEGKESCLLHIVKTDRELEYTPQEMDWIDYTPATAPTAQQIGYDNIKVVTTDLDITNPALTVVKGSDGYYHLDNVNGPIVYVRLSVASPYIAALSDVNEAGQLCRYFYEGETFIRKEHYGVAMNSYIAAADAKSGLYPLDDTLKYIIQNTGEHLGWWNESAMNYIFSEVDEAKDVAWLFPCCTIVTVSMGGAGSDPIIIGEEGKLLMSAGESVKMTYTAAAGESVVFSALPSGSYITVGEDTYTAKDGKITVNFEVGVNELVLSVEDGSNVVIKYKLGE